MSVLESKLEQACRDYAEDRNCIFLKIQGVKGFPDRLLMYPNGVAHFVELKRFNKDQTELQQYIARRLIRMGHQVYVVDNIEMFKRILDERLSTANLGAA